MNEEEKKEFFEELAERVYQKHIECLFEEPCPLYEDDYD